MRYLSSRSFVVGMLLVAASVVVMPLFTTLGEGNCSIPSPVDPTSPSSWDCYQAFRFDFRIPMSMGISGVALMLVSIVRTRRARRFE